MSENQQLLIIIATYNEAESLPELVSQLRQLLPAANLLIIDDNSPDGTGEWALAKANGDDQIDVLLRSGKLGLGSAAVAGFQIAMDKDFVWVATLDADLSHDPVALCQMYDLISKSSNDLAIGSRYVAGGRIVGWPIHRRITSWMTNTFARFVLGLKTKDNTSAMRIYRVDCLRQIELGTMKSTGYSYLEEILVMLKKIPARIVEFPILFQNRELGKSKADLAEVFNSVRQMLALAVRR